MLGIVLQASVCIDLPVAELLVSVVDSPTAPTLDRNSLGPVQKEKRTEISLITAIDQWGGGLLTYITTLLANERHGEEPASVQALPAASRLALQYKAAYKTD